MAPLPLHTHLELFRSPSSFIVQAQDGNQLVFSRASGRMDAYAGKEKKEVRGAGERIAGVFGRLSLATTDVLILIRSSTPGPALLSAPTYLATSYLFLPLTPNELSDPRDRYLLKLAKAGLSEAQGRLWWSPARDLTDTLDRTYKKREADGRPMWETSEDRFFFNKHLQAPFISAAAQGGAQAAVLARFILPVIFGTVVVRQATINSRSFTFALVSRRSRHRVGTRYFTRGVDADGHASNSNETEQIVVVPREGGEKGGEDVFSYVQTRGSVPVFWSQVNTLRYVPDLQVMDKPSTADAVQAHIADQLDFYGDLYLVNLVNQKGYEKPVKEAFEHAMSRLGSDRAHYEYFDFHAECKGMRFDRVSVLIERLRRALEDQGFFHTTTGSAEPAHLQKSIVRTNCMDSLDRTNVVQSALAKHVLNNQLRLAGVLGQETVDDHPDFIHIFRNVWADHADTISIPYSGTGALKTDFTRLGTRTRLGMLNDGKNSVMRYIKNNFFDGAKQDAYDLLTGRWSVATLGQKERLSRILVDERSFTLRLVPYVFFFSLLMVLSSIVLPRHSHAPLSLFLLPWLAVLVVSFLFIIGNGIEYVNWPKLNPPDEVLQYEGGGFRSTRNGRGRDVLFLQGRRAAAKAQAALKKLQ